jgi:hypothetical protein
MAEVAHHLEEREKHRIRAWFARCARAMAPGASWLGLFLMALGGVLIYLLVAAWPAVIAATGSSKPTVKSIHWFGWSYEPTTDSALLILVVLVSALGSYVHAATSFADFVGNRKLSTSWTWWYLLRVFIGVSLAILFYFALRGGIITASSDSNAISPYGVAALSGLVGLFSKQATDKLREIFDTAFHVRPGYGDDARGDSIANPRPVLVAAEPPKLTTNQAIALVLRGSGFASDSVVRVLQLSGEALPRNTTFVDEGALRVELDPADVAAAGRIRFSVYTPPPGGGTSDPLELEIAEESGSPAQP